MSYLFTHQEYHEFALKVKDDAALWAEYCQKRDTMACDDYALVVEGHGDIYAAELMPSGSAPLNRYHVAAVCAGLAGVKVLVSMLTERKLRERAEAALSEADPKDMGHAN